jgi:hypothetical protein
MGPFWVGYQFLLACFGLAICLFWVGYYFLWAWYRFDIVSLGLLQLHMGLVMVGYGLFWVGYSQPLPNPYEVVANPKKQYQTYTKPIGSNSQPRKGI